MSAAMEEVALIVHYQAKTGMGDEVAALLARHTAATRAEPGNLDFVALRGTEDPDSFVLYERYSSADAFKAHQASPLFEGIAVAQIRPLLAERRLEVRRVVQPVPAKCIDPRCRAATTVTDWR
jgi:quinol monooxygenase YgiN